MKKAKLKTALIGFGRIAQGYSKDPIMARHFRYATHAQVLSQHPQFNWLAVVDPSAPARKEAQSRWGIKNIAEHPQQLTCADEIEIAVIATPPEDRGYILDAFPNLRAIIIEKPLAMDLQTSIRLAETCRKRKILAQVNLVRRADRLTRKLAGSRLKKTIGTMQAGFGIYGNGLLNNGTHMIDLVRMLTGEITSVQAIADGPSFAQGPISGDINIAFNLILENDIVITLQPVSFDYYRENCLDLWGNDGRLSYMHGGMTVLSYPRKKNRLISKEYEVAVDKPRILEPTIGTAIYEIYTNLANTLAGKEALLSPIESALETASVVEAILQSAHNNGKPVRLEDLLSVRI